MVKKNRKKIGLGVLAATLAGAGFATMGPGETMFQATEVQAESQFENLTYVDNGDGTATITSYNFASQEVTIPSEIDGLTVTHIGEDAFRWSYSLEKDRITSLSIPDTVTHIGSNAFRLNALTELVIPDSVVEVGSYAFNSGSIKDLTLSKNMERIEASTFGGNEISELAIPENIKEIGSGAFSNNNLTSIVIPETVSQLGNSVFMNNQLTSASLPNHMTTLPKDFFRGNNFTEFEVPEQITRIESGVFRYNKLESVSIPDHVTHIGEYAFSGNELTEFELPQSLRTMGESALSSNNLTEVKIPKLLSVIPQGAFASNQITKVFLPLNVSTVEPTAYTTNPVKEVTVLNDMIVFEENRFLSDTFTSEDIIFYGNIGSTTQSFAQEHGHLFLQYEEPEEETEEPTNPDEGSTPVEDQSHDNKATFNLVGGVFELVTSPILSFGDIEMPIEATTYNTSFEGPLQVKDLRGTQDGWRVDVSATPFAQVEPEGGFAEGTEQVVLPTGTLSLNPLENITRVGEGAGDLPTNELNGTTAIDDGSVTLVRADEGSGAGEFELTFPEEALSLTLDPATVKVDKENYPNGKTPYESTLKWDLIQAP